MTKCAKCEHELFPGCERFVVNNKMYCAFCGEQELDLYLDRMECF